MTSRHAVRRSLLAVSVYLLAACGKDGPTAPPVATLIISRDTATLVPTVTVQLTATPKDANGNDLTRAISWSSSDETKATVSSNGLVTGVAPGLATITAGIDGRVARTQITVKEGALVGAAGGTITALNGVVTLTIAAGALQTSTMVTVAPATTTPATNRLVSGTAVELGPSTLFGIPVQLKLRYAPASVPTGASEQLLQINRLSTSNWETVPGSSVDVAAKTVTATVTTFSVYSILSSPIAGVTLSATSATLGQGSTLQLTATARDASNNIVGDAPFEWSSANSAIASVSATGLVTAVGVGGPVAITAKSNGRTGSANITVSPRPAMTLDASSLIFAAPLGGANPVSQSVQVGSATAGAISGLSANVTYETGQPTGWLAATLSQTSTPASLTVQPTTGALPAGTYNATVTVSSTVDGIASKSIAVTFSVGGSQPVMALSATTASFAASTGGANPTPATISVTNNGTGTLSGLTAQVTYPAGDATSWLGATFSTPTAPATLTLAPNIAGVAAGTHTATVTIASTAAGVPTRAVSVTLVLTNPSITVNAGDNQAAMAGSPVSIAPTVIVHDGTGAPMPNLTVTFAVASGDGSIGSPAATTDASGIASVGSWTLGPVANPNSLTATVSGPGFTSGNNSVSFGASGCTGGGGTGYAITLCFVTTMTSTQRAAFTDAAAHWGTLITGDVPDLTVTIPAGICGTNSPALGMSVDDVLIFARIEPIDGVNGILGSAGPCLIRTAGALPIVGTMRFDVADVASLEASSQLRDVILHEMGHVLGIGVLWSRLGLLQNPSTVGGPQLDTYFSGTNAVQGFNSIGGDTYTKGQKVPVENQGGGGTINAHWRESVLANELMTGFLNSGANPLSVVTVKSLQDLGYLVNPNLADPFQLTLSLQAAGARTAPPRPYGDDIMRGPLFGIDASGRMSRIRP
jgi:Leishmanolysin/Bacterial Ig-like domain (group 2)